MKSFRSVAMLAIGLLVGLMCLETAAQAGPLRWLGSKIAGIGKRAARVAVGAVRRAASIRPIARVMGRCAAAELDAKAATFVTAPLQLPAEEFPQLPPDCLIESLAQAAADLSDEKGEPGRLTLAREKMRSAYARWWQRNRREADQSLDRTAFAPSLRLPPGPLPLP